MTKWDLQQEWKTTSTLKTQSVQFTLQADSERKEIGGNHGPFEKGGEIDGGGGDRNCHSEHVTTIIPPDQPVKCGGQPWPLVTGGRHHC